MLSERVRSARPEKQEPPGHAGEPTAPPSRLVPVTRHGFVDIGSVPLAPMHAVTSGRRPA